MKKDNLIERGVLQKFILGLCDQEDEALVRSQLAVNTEMKDVTHDMETMLTEMISMHIDMPCSKSKKSCLEQSQHFSSENEADQSQ